MATWTFGIESWVIQDGNYDDFVVGQQEEFAVEFYLPDGPTFIDPDLKSARALGDGWYDITGTVVATAKDGLAVDCGLVIYSDQATPARIGQWIRAKALLQLDYYWYCEVLSKRPDFPPQMYSWTIESIRRKTAPYVPDPETGGKIREPGNEASVEIPSTDAWNDDGGHATYVLECRLGDDAPWRRVDDQP